MRISAVGVVLGIAVVIGVVACTLAQPQGSGWTDKELTTIQSLWIGSLPTLPPDPSNKYADDPRAAKLGQKIFFDTRFSVNGKVACASCHKPELSFTDGRAQAKGVGETPRKSMSIVGSAYSPWLFWDGRKDSLWAQALGPLENPLEHGGNRTMYAHLIAKHYRAEFEAIFGKLPDFSKLPAAAAPVADATTRAAWEKLMPETRASITRVYVNIGKAIAAFERKILPGVSRFDMYAKSLLEGNSSAARFTADEVAGLKLFVGRANCTNCHNGALLTNNAFHNTGIPIVPDLPEDTGRAQGVKQVLEDEFNCLSAYSDAKPSQCAELRFLKADGTGLVRAFKPPSLRNVAQTAPYMEVGQKKTLREVLEHYNQAPEAPAGHSELKPLGLSSLELNQLEAFLKSLSAPLSTVPELLKPPPGVPTASKNP
jgi:cytochrome c peroxidase